MFVRRYGQAKEADAAYSLGGWAYRLLEFAFPTVVATAVMWAASYRDWIWNDYGVFGIAVLGVAVALAVSIAMVLSGLGVRAWRRSASGLRQSTAEWDEPLEKRFRVNFQNETVLIDGYEFIECTFENVTFQYQGTKPFRFTGKTSGNSRKLTTDNVVVGQTLTLIQFFRPDIGINYEVYKTGTRPPQRSALHSETTTEQKLFIAQARKFVARTVGERPGDADYFKTKLESDIAFLGLRTHLSEEFIQKLTAERTIYLPRENSNMPALADWYVTELNRLEKGLH